MRPFLIANQVRGDEPGGRAVNASGKQVKRRRKPPTPVVFTVSCLAVKGLGHWRGAGGGGKEYR